MLIDCDSCAVRGLACGDCVVTVLLGVPSPTSGDSGARPADGPVTRVELDGPERAAIAVLSGQGLVPPLRLVPSEEGRQPAQQDEHDRADRSDDRADRSAGSAGGSSEANPNGDTAPPRAEAG